MKSAPDYLQLDNSIFSDLKITIMLKRHGADGLAVFIYCLTQMNQSETGGMVDNELFYEAASIMLGIGADDVKMIVATMVKIGLLYDEDGELFNHGYQKRTGAYREANMKRSEAQKRLIEERRAKEAEPEAKTPKPKKPKPQPSPEQEPEQPLSTLAKVIKEEAQRLIDITDGSNVTRPTNRKCTLTASEYEKLAEYAKQGCGSIEAEKLARQLVREFYTWKFTADRAVKSDYLSMIKPWVLEKAQKHFSNPQRQPEPERSGPQQMTDLEKDQARDRTYSANRKMYDGRIGKSWEGLTEQEIENMIKSRQYDESGKRIGK